MDFLLAHGSTQSPRGYGRLAAALEQRGHRTVAVDLPRDRPEWTAERYADVARAQAAALVEPVLVVHSAAGALAPAIAAATGARHIAWLAAVLPDAGRSVLDEIRSDDGMFAAEWRPPSTYVLPTEDRTLTPDWMRRAAAERLGTEPVELSAGHCPHVSRPGQVAALLDS